MELLPTAITIEQLSAIELRVGTIEHVATIAGADKLYVLTVDFGAHGKRTICAGIKMFFTPEQLTGIQALFAFNLEPRTLRGVESQGMIMVAKDEQSVPVIMKPERAVPAGTRLS